MSQVTIQPIQLRRQSYSDPVDIDEADINNAVKLVYKAIVDDVEEEKSLLYKAIDTGDEAEVRRICDNHVQIYGFISTAFPFPKKRNNSDMEDTKEKRHEKPVKSNKIKNNL